MKKGLKHFFWIFSNEWGGVLGWPALAPLHRVLLNLSLHGLGYDNPYHSGEEWFIKNILAEEEVSVCLDIGANVGNYSSFLIDEFSCTVYAIEPLSSSFGELEKKAASYGGKLIPRRYAASDYVGEGVMSAKADFAETATLDFTGPSQTLYQERVPITTIDEFVKQERITRVDFIKIDTEGFEREVLRGMSETLMMLKPKYVQFEFNIMQLKRGYTVRDMQALMPTYTLYRLLPHGWVPLNPNSFADNIFMFQNIVAIRNDIY